MMNNETVNPIKTTSYVDLDLMIEADDADTILAEARAYAMGFARIPDEELVVALITTHGSAGGWPIVRFMAEPSWLEQLVTTYEAEAEGN